MTDKFTRNQKHSLKQKSIASFFSQVKSKQTPKLATKSQSFAGSTEIKTISIDQDEARQKSKTTFKSSRKLTSSKSFTSTIHNNAKLDSNVDIGNTIGTAKTVLIQQPTLQRALSSSLFSSQGSFAEYNPSQELERLKNNKSLNNFKRPVLNSKNNGKLPFGLTRSGSSFSSTPSSSPIKKSVELDDIVPHEVTKLNAGGRRQLSFTTSAHIDSLSQIETSTQLETVPSLKRTNSSGFNFSNLKRLKPTISGNTIKQTSKSKSNTIKNEPIVLTKEQEHVIDLIVNKKQNVFYTGSAGTGKSVILSNILEQLKRLYGSESVAITASTGLAAATIGGITLHKWSNIGIGNKSVGLLVKAIEKRADAKMSWKKTRVLIIDEISMIDGTFLTKLEYVARTIRRNDRPFGGIQLVFTGDFFQLPPVSKRDNNNVVTPPMFCFETEAWKRCIQKTILLTKVFRQKDNTLVDILNCIRYGKIDKHMVPVIKKLEREVIYEDGIQPTEIYATRREVDNSNSRQLNNLSGMARKFEAEDVAPPHLRSLLDSSFMAEKVLTLKEEAQVMNLKNKSELELVNGTLGKILFFTTTRLMRKLIELHRQIDYDAIMDMRMACNYIGKSDMAHVELFQRQLENIPLSRHAKLMELVNSARRESPSEELLPYVRWSVGKKRTYDELVQREEFVVDVPGEKVGIQRRQLPIMLCWALSIHKAQGQTISRLSVDLRNIFEAGQVYVALSRATSLEQLQVKNFDARRIRTNAKVVDFYKNLQKIHDL